MSGRSEEMSVDYTRWLETATTALIVGAAIVVASLFQASEADTRAARGSKQRGDIVSSINAMHVDFSKLKSCRPG